MQAPPRGLNWFDFGAGLTCNLQGGGRATEFNKLLIGQIPKSQIDVVHFANYWGG